MDDDFWTKSGGTITDDLTPLRVVQQRDPATYEARRRLLQPEQRPRSRREPLVIGLVLAVAVLTLVFSYLGARNDSLLTVPPSTEDVAETESALAVPASTVAPTASTVAPTTIAVTLPPVVPPTTLPAAVPPPSLTDDFVNEFSGQETLPADADPVPDVAMNSDQLAPNLAGALDGLNEDTPILATGVVLDLDEVSPDGESAAPEEPEESEELEESEESVESQAVEAAGPVTALEANADFLSLANEIFGAGGPEIVALENNATTASSTYAIEDSVRFEYKSRTIIQEHLELLDNVVTLLERRPNVTIEVVGHTDSRGDADKNLALSQARADTVMAYLMYRGIDPRRLTSVGLGETGPVASNDTEDGRRLNRRIRLVLDPQTD